MKIIEIRDDALIRKPITQRARWIQMLLAVSLVLTFHLYLFDSDKYPPYNKLKTIEGKLAKVQSNKKVEDYIIIETENNQTITLYQHFIRNQKSVVQGLLNKVVIAKYYESNQLGLVTDRLAEIYYGEKRVFGDYKKTLDRVKKGTGNWFFIGIIWFPLFIFLLITFKRPLKKEVK